MYGWVVVLIDWQDILKVRPRKRKRKPDPPNIFSGETGNTDKKRVMGRGLMRDLKTGELIPSKKENTDIAQGRKRTTNASGHFMPEKRARLGSQRAKAGEVNIEGTKSPARRFVYNKATKNFPRHRCARCGRNLSIGQRRDIVVDGKKLGMSFCQRCATDMVKE